MLIYDFSLGDSHKDYKEQLREHCKKYKIIDEVCFPLKDEGGAVDRVTLSSVHIAVDNEPRYRNVKKVSFPLKEYITTIADAPKEFESVVMSRDELTRLRCNTLTIGALIMSGLIIGMMICLKLLM
jgi:hypothetical protein